MQPEINSLVVDLNGKSFRLVVAGIIGLGHQLDKRLNYAYIAAKWDLILFQ